MSDNIFLDMESQISILKVYIHDLKKENRKLKAIIKTFHENFLKIENK